MNPFTVPAQDVLHLEASKHPRRKQPKKRVHREPLAGSEEVGSSAERVGDHECLSLGPPKCQLPPEGQVHSPKHLERRAGNTHGRRMVKRDAPAPREGDAVSCVPVEKLDDAHGLAEHSDSLVELERVDGVDQPHLPVVRERM